MLISNLLEIKQTKTDRQNRGNWVKAVVYLLQMSEIAISDLSYELILEINNDVL